MFEKKPDDFLLATLIKSAETTSKKPFPASLFYILRDPSFISLHHESIENDPLNLYSGNKIHFNLADNDQLAKAWNAIIPILTANESIVRSVKVVVPEWVESVHQANLVAIDVWKGLEKHKVHHRKIVNEDRDRRLSGTQITLHVYFKSVADKTIDYEAYILLVRAIEKAFLLAGITPPAETFLPKSDTKLSQYASMREDIDSLGKAYAFNESKDKAPSAVINEFVKQMNAVPVADLQPTSSHPIEFKPGK